MGTSRFCSTAVAGGLSAILVACGGSSSTRLTENSGSEDLGNPDICASLGQRTPGPPVVVTTERLPAYLIGRPGSSDGAGTVLLVLMGHFDATNLYFYEPDGSLKHSQHEFNLTPLEQRSGFAGMQNQRFSTPRQFRVFRLSTDGALQYGSAQNGHALQAADPRGGIVLFSIERNELQSYDETMHLRWSSELTPVISNPASVSALGVDVEGNILVLFDGTREFGAGTLGGVWVDAFGSAGRNFQAASGVSAWDELNLVTSVTEGLFLQHVRYTYQAPVVTWIGFYVPHVQSQLAPPSWLAERPGTSMAPILGSKGYGLFSHPSPPGSNCVVEVLTASGESCGRIDFARDGRDCRSIAIGYDGTVITQPMQRWTEDCNATTDGACSWTWQWWPGFFR